MQAMLALAPGLLQALGTPSPEATKAVAELAMAVNFLAQAHGPQRGLCDLAGVLSARLLEDGHLAMLGHPFQMVQALTPYVFLRDIGPRLPALERVLAIWAATRPDLTEVTPYRRAERAYLRARLGLGALPGWRGSAILRDARAAWAFDRDLSYAFTHVVLFGTDFAAIRRPDPFVKGMARLRLDEAQERSDVDLVWELALCLLTQDLTEQELAEALSACAAMRAGFDILTDPARITATYHPVLVHDILAARLWQHHRLDLPLAKAGETPTLAALGAFRRALAGKDAVAMQGAFAALPPADWSRAMLRARLADLRRQTRSRTLFLRETGGAEPDGPIYADYSRQIGQLIAACA
ncbi:MAG: hypothetical protein IPF96_15735 [Rhodobacter sp.]|nr:hypothetical protein [Rhodobacter sp.]